VYRHAEESRVTHLDWLIAAIVVLTALGGYRRGLIGSVLSLAGLVAGAIVGARLASHYLAGGDHSRYTALVGLVAAVVGISVFRLLASIVARFIRGGLHLMPPLRLLDSLGGLLVGAIWGLAFVWVLGAVALQVPGRPKIRRDVRQSQVLRQLDQVAPPHDLLKVQKRLATMAGRLRE
jgi:uncharacterized membrane protein required for colicin V production